MNKVSEHTLNDIHPGLMESSSKNAMATGRRITLTAKNINIIVSHINLKKTARIVKIANNYEKSMVTSGLNFSDTT